MKVVFKKKLVEEILEQIVEGEKEGKKVAYIEVTKSELEQLRTEIHLPHPCPDWHPARVQLQDEFWVWKLFGHELHIV